MLKKFFALSAMLSVVFTAAAAPEVFDLKKCAPSIGLAPQPPAITVEDIPNIGKAVVAKPVAKGNYQGVIINLDTPLEATEIDSISFKFGQNVRPMEAKAKEEIGLEPSSWKEEAGSFFSNKRIFPWIYSQRHPLSRASLRGCRRVQTCKISTPSSPRLRSVSQMASDHVLEL